MREDLLKEQLMRYATDGAERASQPEVAVIRRRGRRHYQRLAALAVAGALVVAGGVGLGLGLGRAGSAVPVVNQPRPPTTIPGPAVTGRMPETFVAGIDGRVAVFSTRTGRIVRTLWGPDPAAPQVYAVGSSPDRRTVYFSAAGPSDPCDRSGIFRVPFDGGPATTLVPGEYAEGLITTSADGSRLAYLGGACPYTGRFQVVLRDAGGALLRRWTATSGGVGFLHGDISLSPDGRLLAAPVHDEATGQSVGLRVLDAALGSSVADGRPLHAPDRGCELVNAAFHPRDGQLAAFERCLRSGAVPRFRLVYLDPASGRVRGRSFAFDDRSGADLTIESTDFDRGGRWLLYAVGSYDPMDSQEPRPETGTWWHGAGRRVRVHDDQRIGSGDASQLITSTFPSW
jgi:hypothetical protein